MVKMGIILFSEWKIENRFLEFWHFGYKAGGRLKNGQGQAGFSPAAALGASWYAGRKPDAGIPAA